MKTPKQNNQLKRLKTLKSIHNDNPVILKSLNSQINNLNQLN